MGMRTAILSGDSEPAVATAGAELGIDEVRAALSPASKVAALRAEHRGAHRGAHRVLMVCTGKAAGEIAEVVGAKASVTAPARTDHLYSCGYVYTEGTMVLSVKELSSWAQTYAYFGNLAQTMHRTAAVKGLGQGAFVVRDGSVVVRKDWKVLVVNISGLHGNIGSPPNSPSEVALLVVAVILGCWSGD